MNAPVIMVPKPVKPKQLKILAVVHELGEGCPITKIHEHAGIPRMTRQALEYNIHQMELYGLLRPHAKYHPRAVALSEKGREVLRQAKAAA